MKTDNITIIRGSYGQRLTFTLKDADGNARNMSSYSAKLQAWSPLVPGTLTIDKSCTWSNQSGGVCYYDLASGDFNTVGVYQYHILATATGISEPALSGFIVVMQYGGNYCTLAEIKELLGLVDESYDAIIQSDIVMVKQFIDDLAKRRFDTVSETRYFDGADKVLFIDELASAPTSIKLDEDADGTYEVTLASSDYVLYPLNGYPKTMVKVATGGDYSYFARGVEKGVQIVGTWGNPTVPEPIRKAATIQVMRWFKRRESAFQDVVGSPETGEMIVYKNLDPDVAQIVSLREHSRKRFA